MADIPLVPELEQPLPRVSAPEGLLAWVASVDHKQIGIMYLLTSGFFFLVGGLEALALRVQLAQPDLQVLNPDLYNQIFTMHGTTMIFLVVVPLLIGFATYLTPLMIGARDLLFPRLNALSYWVLLFGGLLLYYSFVSGAAPNVGWFSYAPLSEKPYADTLGVDYWALGLLVVGVGTVGAGVNLIATIFLRRAEGLTMRRLPLFVWMVLINSFLIVFALPALNASLATLLADRQLAAHFFRTTVGGSAVLWQHFFWSFGHPEVYIMVLPAFGIISEVVPVFSRKPIYGYSFVAASTVGIGLLSFAVWAHHMFAVGMGRPWDTVFSVASMLIAIPTGVKIFSWIGTMWGGAIRFTTAMLFATSFLIVFTIGGISGVMFAVVPVDWQLTDSYFVVAHLHYVLFGGTMFAILAGTYYWFPKITGRLLSERLGKLHFWLTFVGFNLTFFVQHFLGLAGMPRRVATYADNPGWGLMNLISTAGAFVLGLSVLVFLLNLWRSLHSGERAGDNPWRAWTLEWATASPPPVYNFSDLPRVRSRRPLWDLAHPENPDYKANHGGSGKTAQPNKILAYLGEPNRLGMALFLANETVFFALLIAAYLTYYHNFGAGISGPGVLDLPTTGIYTACLLASSFTVWRAERSLSERRHGWLIAWLLATVALGAIFLYGQGSEYLRLIGQSLTINRNQFGTVFYTLTGFHGLHVLSGLVMLLIIAALALGGKFKAGRSSGLSAIALYWHFVDAVWVVLFTLIYIVPQIVGF